MADHAAWAIKRTAPTAVTLWPVAFSLPTVIFLRLPKSVRIAASLMRCKIALTASQHAQFLLGSS
jgi:hypothetical protein